ncbi:MAG TPA: FAD-dependent oxidoreductase [Candidatus Polarisedimenticolaceae bacterium]|nr:FAD-dependent oxidoreductase [Candidatus Polarisedimenticolaceae bacterium]
MPGTRVTVVGAGVIGSATALELARRGLAVTVLDRGGIAAGCSRGNAGWLTPCFSTPLPAPGVLTGSLKWLLDPESPLRIAPSLRPDWLRWMARFVASARATPYQAGTEALLALSRYSFQAYRALDAGAPGSFGFAQRGLLLVAQDPHVLAHAAMEAERMGRLGIRWERLDPDEVRSLEPALRLPVAGGIFYPDEAHCEPELAVRALARAAEAAGARFATAEVLGFDLGNGRVTALHTTAGKVESDQVVLATGSWSKTLGRALGLRLPVLGGKGYTVLLEDVAPLPSLPIKLYEPRVALTPRATGLRVAGTLELVDGDESVSRRRVEAVLRAGLAALGVKETPRIVEVWRGLRPCTPDGLPIIGRARGIDNLVLATGHQMCGLHTAPGTARLAADLLMGAPPTFDPRPFRADRF